jgi:transketolase
MSPLERSIAAEAPELTDFQRRASRIRARVIQMACAARAPHVASSLSCVDVLTALYFHALRIDPRHPDDPMRDRFILSKGHACSAQYAALAERGFFPEKLLEEYARNGGRLAEHPGPSCVPGIEAATGSLGHGLSIGIGLAYAAKLQRRPSRVFVLLSDGECHEGSVWEAAMFAPAHALDNLVAIVDDNQWSALQRSRAPMALDPLAAKWTAFGWRAVEVDGHDAGSLVATLSRVPLEPGRPTALIARTVKGKGVSFMENDLEWHYRPPTASDTERALRELGMSET